MNISQQMHSGCMDEETLISSSSSFSHNIKDPESTPRPAEDYFLVLNIYSGLSRPCWDSFSPHIKLEMKMWMM